MARRKRRMLGQWQGPRADVPYNYKVEVTSLVKILREAGVIKVEGSKVTPLVPLDQVPQKNLYRMTRLDLLLNRPGLRESQFCFQV